MRYEEIIEILQDAECVPAGKPIWESHGEYLKLAKIIEAAIRHRDKSGGEPMAWVEINKKTGGRNFYFSKLITKLDDHEVFPLYTHPSKEELPLLVNGARFKVSSSEHGVAIFGLPNELSGEWVALVSANNDEHFKCSHTAKSIIDESDLIGEDLLNALIDCVSFLENDLANTVYVRPELQKARAAIAKARGEQA